MTDYDPHADAIGSWRDAIEEKRRRLLAEKRCIRCDNGERACVRGNPDTCSWREATRKYTTP